MSLSDYIKYQRALKGGLTPWEIAEGSGVPAREVHLIEVKHRRMGEDASSIWSAWLLFRRPIEELGAGERLTASGLPISLKRASTIRCPSS